MNMLTHSLVESAVELATPQIKAVFEDPRCTWGPKLVAVVVDGPGLEPTLSFVGDVNQPWEKDWPPMVGFSEIAAWKASAARRHGRPTSELVHLHPLLLQKGDFFYPGGVVDRSGEIGIGVSGIKGWADEMCAYVVAAVMNGIAHLELDELRASDVSKL